MGSLKIVDGELLVDLDHVVYDVYRLNEAEFVRGGKGEVVATDERVDSVIYELLKLKGGVSHKRGV